MMYLLSTAVIFIINYSLIRKREIGVYILFSNIYYLIYVAIPFLLEGGYIDQPNYGGGVKIINRYREYSYLSDYANAIIFLGLLVILIFSFWNIKEKKVSWFNESDIYKAGIYSIIFGSLAFGVVIVAAGGLVELLSIANAMRAGEESVPGGFLLQFAKLLWPGSIVLFGAIIEGRSSKYILFGYSVVASILVLFVEAGRALFLIYFASLVYIFYIKNKEIYLGYTFLTLLVGVLIVVYGPSLFRAFAEKGAIATRTEILLQGGAYLVVQSVLREFIFPYTNILLAIHDVQGFFDLYLLDLPKAILNTLPAGSVGFPQLNTLSDYNTLKYGTEGEIPIDLVSFGYYTFGAFGVVVSIFFYSYFFKKMDSILGGYKGYIFCSLHAILACKLCFIAMYADLHQVISGNFYIITFLLIVFSLGGVRSYLEDCIDR